jgi:hypothetical protein
VLAQNVQVIAEVQLIFPVHLRGEHTTTAAVGIRVGLSAPRARWRSVRPLPGAVALP